MKKELKTGSVGTSSIMDVMQEAIRLTDGIRCTAVYSRNEQRGRAYAQKTGAGEVFTDYEAFIRSEDLDIIYIASPNDCHVEQACRALSCGKHVILEKPASLTREGIRQLDRTARENHVYWFEAITTLFMPNYLACKALLPRIGGIRRVEIRYGQYSSKYDAYLKGIISSSLDPARQGGALNDMGVYCIHPAVDLFGVPDTVSYEPVTGYNGIDLEGVCTLTYRDTGLVCTLQAAKNRDIGSGCLIEGENGIIQEDGPMNDFGSVSVSIRQKSIPVRLQYGENRMLYELAVFRDAINRGDQLFYERMCRQSLQVAGILEDIHAGSRT